MEYKKLSTILKRYSFSEKMKILQIYSSNLMTLSGINQSDKMLIEPFPWELETFLLFAVSSKEWKQDKFDDTTRKNFINIINCIRNHTHKTIDESKETIKFIDNLMISIASVQYDSQEYLYYKMYRSNFYFSFTNKRINMPQLFYKKFGCDYNEILLFVQFLWMVFTEKDIALNQRVYEYHLRKFESVLTNLSISRQGYIDELNKITSDYDDYLYCLRPSYTYPFIVEQNAAYLPLPHLLIRSITTSLLYRITQGNNSLAELIGKEVLESYLYKIINESELFDEVHPEAIYYVKTVEQRTIDVMARKNNEYVFFDSKMYSPNRDLRIFDEEIYEKEITRLAEACKQMYLHINDKFPKHYNPFSTEHEINIDNIYGIVVIRDDPNIRPEHIYKKASELLRININSDKYDWMCKHIGITPIYQIERYCFTKSDILSAVRKNKTTNSINDFWFISSIENSKITHDGVKQFKHELGNKVVDLAKEYNDKNLFD